MSTVDRSRILVEQTLGRDTRRIPSALRHEILRKCIHLLIAFVPSLAAFDLSLAVGLLASGTLYYVLAEMARRSGRPVFLISEVTVLASRERDTGRFVLSPVTLGVGAMLALMLYPLPASTIAIYALAFGDGLASLAGKVFGGTKVPYTGGKTVQGSLACFLAVISVTLAVTRSPLPSLVIALSATFLELLPTGDFDNIVLPVGTGLVALLLAPFTAATGLFL